MDLGRLGSQEGGTVTLRLNLYSGPQVPQKTGGGIPCHLRGGSKWIRVKAGREEQ